MAKKEQLKQKTEDERLLVKSCYSHIGGKFGLLLTNRFEELGWIEKDRASKHFFLTPEGVKEFKKIGVDFSEL